MHCMRTYFILIINIDNVKQEQSRRLSMPGKAGQHEGRFSALREDIKQT